MRIYKTYYWDRDEGQLLFWATSKAAAEKWLRTMQEKGDSQGPAMVELVKFPETKQDIIAWLNSNLQTDNG